MQYILITCIRAYYIGTSYIMHTHARTHARTHEHARTHAHTYPPTHTTHPYLDGGGEAVDVAAGVVGRDDGEGVQVGENL